MNHKQELGQFIHLDIAMSTKGVNSSDSSNRLRFENLSQRLRKVNVDVVHRVRKANNLDGTIAAAPDTGAKGCHFQDELEQVKELYCSSVVKR